MEEQQIGRVRPVLAKRARVRARSMPVASGPPPGRGHGLPHAPSLLHSPDVLQELSSPEARYIVESASQSRKRLRAENTMEVRAGVEPRQATVKRTEVRTNGRGNKELIKQGTLDCFALHPSSAWLAKHTYKTWKRTVLATRKSEPPVESRYTRRTAKAEIVNCTCHFYRSSWVNWVNFANH